MTKNGRQSSAIFITKMKILTNTQIYTMDIRNPRADSIAIEESEFHSGKIIAVGKADQIIDAFGTGAKIQDMNGAVIIPGLIDAHFHLRHYAHNLKRVNLFELSKEECLQRISERVNSTPEGKWILGHGWNQIHFSDDFPTVADLDKIAPNHPVYLTATSLHAAWCNTAAFKAAGINNQTTDPPNGSFSRNEYGEPNGLLFEFAMNLVADHIPQPTLNENKAAIKDALPKLWKQGLTGLHDFDRFPSYDALKELETEQKLSLRVVKSLPVEELDKILEMDLHTGLGSDVLRLGSIKVFMDGALGARTAAMLEPFENEPDNLGMLFMEGGEFFELTKDAASAGWSIAAHAIGDRANHELLNGYEKLRAFENDKGIFTNRHRIEHLQTISPEDLHKLVELNLIASMQPYHLAADMDMSDQYWGARSKNTFVFRSLVNLGVDLAFGSDAPVDSENPFHGIHSAVNRRRSSGHPNEDGWYPNEKIALIEAIYAYTAGASFAGNSENKYGTLKEGNLADLIVIEEDIFKIDSMQLFDIKPKATMLGGEWVWKS